MNNISTEKFDEDNLRNGLIAKDFGYEKTKENLHNLSTNLIGKISCSRRNEKYVNLPFNEVEDAVINKFNLIDKTTEELIDAIYKDEKGHIRSLISIKTKQDIYDLILGQFTSIDESKLKGSNKKVVKNIIEAFNERHDNIEHKYNCDNMIILLISRNNISSFSIYEKKLTKIVGKITDIKKKKNSIEWKVDGISYSFGNERKLIAHYKESDFSILYWRALNLCSKEDRENLMDEKGKAINEEDNKTTRIIPLIKGNNEIQKTKGLNKSKDYKQGKDSIEICLYNNIYKDIVDFVGGYDFKFLINNELIDAKINPNKKILYTKNKSILGKILLRDNLKISCKEIVTKNLLVSKKITAIVLTKTKLHTTECFEISFTYCPI